MNKKGFTLIELLAVIVILAIIALIAVPIILNVIDTAKKGSKESSVLGYIDAVEKQVMISKANTALPNINSGTYSVEQLNNLNVEVKGEKPKNTSVLTINNKGQVIEGWFTYSGTNYKIYYNGKKVIANNNDYVDSNGVKHNEIATPGANALSGPTKVEAASGETHKGIVYLDPTDLTKYCNETLASQNVNEFGTPTEIKTGCMKWYIFDDSGDNYKMILDHNTTARIKWNDSNSNVAYESSNLKTVVDDLVTTSKWQVNPRIISANEVVQITGKTGFNVNDENAYYYLSTNSQVLASFNETTRSKYDWLYNNSNKCKTDSTDYGCTIEDNNTYVGTGTAGNGNTWGYWASTPVGTAGSGNYVWNITRGGYLYDNRANGVDRGIRPVIEVSKSSIN